MVCGDDSQLRHFHDVLTGSVRLLSGARFMLRFWQRNLLVLHRSNVGIEGCAAAPFALHEMWVQQRFDYTPNR